MAGVLENVKTNQGYMYMYAYFHITSITEQFLPPICIRRPTQLQAQYIFFNNEKLQFAWMFWKGRSLDLFLFSCFDPYGGLSYFSVAVNQQLTTLSVINS